MGGKTALLAFVLDNWIKKTKRWRHDKGFLNYEFAVESDEPFVAIERNIAEWDITSEIGPNEKGFPETITSPTTGSSFEGKTDRLETVGSGPQRSCVQIPNGPEFFSGLISTTSSVVFIAARIAYISFLHRSAHIWFSYISRHRGNLVLSTELIA